MLNNKQNWYVKNKFLKLFNLKEFKRIFKLMPYLILIDKGYSVSINTKKKFLISYLTLLKKNSMFLFNTLTDIITIDYPWKKNRYKIIYVLKSLTYNKIYYLNIKTSKKEIYSISSLFFSSAWPEREVWDFFGILFLYNKNLKRILTDYGFKGNPLKKDFPLIGFNTINYGTWGSVINYKKL